MQTIQDIGIRRGAFTGVLQIVRFNWRMYAFTIAAGITTSVVLVLGSLSETVRWLLGVGAVAGILWTLNSLIVSHWVYDRSHLCRWKWIAEAVPVFPKHWAHIHAGLDESSSSIRKLFPQSRGTVVDIFDPNEMTEQSIAEARKSVDEATNRANLRCLSFPAKSLDLVFLIFTAHEIRAAASRAAFFSELNRVLMPNGRVLMVEHMRDWRNFVAFGPGFLHFLSRSEWLSRAREANFTVEREFTITPFVCVFLFKKEVP
jgi:SAM-dependent methyltransferase